MRKSNINAYGRKGCERNYTEMPVATKEPSTNACGKERKNKPHMPVTKKKKEQTTNTCGNKRKNKPHKPVAKERKKQMPVAKKESTNHKCLWQTKNGFPNQANKQLTPNEKTKQLKPPQKPKQLPTCNSSSLIDYVLSQLLVICDMFLIWIDEWILTVLQNIQ